MEENYINEVKFTPTEIQVISCFSSNANKPRTIAEILDKSVKTIYIHLDKIKTKTDVTTIDDISLFVRKSDKFQELRKIFNKQYIDYFYRKASRKIAYQLKPLNIVCNLIVSKESHKNPVVTKITTAIELTGVKLNKIDNLQLLSKLSNANDKEFCVYIINNADEIEQDNMGEQKLKPSILYLILNTSPKQALSDKNNVLFFNEGNLNKFYIFFTSHLAKYYTGITKLNEATKFLLEIDKIEKNIQISMLEDFTNIPNNKTETNDFKHPKKTIPYDIPLSHKATGGEIKNKSLLTFKNLSVSLAAILFLFCIGYVSMSLLTNKNLNSNSILITEINIPLLTDFYVERKALTNAIWNRFAKTSEQNPLVIVGLTGLGGVGKTTLATEIIRHPKLKYSFKAWFNAETEDLLKSDFLELGRKLKLYPENVPEKTKINIIKEWLCHRKNTLLVFDNAPNAELAHYYLPNAGNIIITSRNHEIPSKIAIDVMQENEALFLLQKLLPKQIINSDNHLSSSKNLIKELGALPLAISQAGAYMTEHIISTADYLSLFKSKRKDLLLHKTMPSLEKHVPAYITWNMNIKAMKKHEAGEKAIKLLDFVAYCSPNDIPRTLLIQYLNGNINKGNEIEFNNALGLLRKYSFLKLSLETVSIHRLLQAWARDQHTNNKKAEILKKSSLAIKKAYINNRETTRNLIFTKNLIPHVESVLLENKENDPDNMVSANLTSVLGNCYKVTGNLQKSKQLLNHAMKLNVGLYGAKHIETAIALKDLGQIYHLLGNHSQAEHYLKQAMKIFEKHYGSNHPQTAKVLYSLGRNYLRAGNDILGKQALERAAVLLKHSLGDFNIQTTKVYKSLGWALYHTGDYINSTKYLEKSLLGHKDYYGHFHADTAVALNSLAWNYLYLGKTTEAKPLFEQAMEINKKCYGLEHIQTAKNQNGLGWVLLEMGAYKKSDQLLRQALKTFEKNYGHSHVQVIKTTNALSWCNFLMGKHKQAINLANKALLNIGRTKTESEQKAKLLNNISCMYFVLGDYVKSKNLLEEANTIISKDNIYAATIKANLGNIYRLINNPKNGKEMLEEALHVLNKNNFPVGVQTAKIMFNLGLVYKDLNNNKNKMSFFNKALEIFDKELKAISLESKFYALKFRASLKSFNKNIARKQIGYPLVLPI